MSQTTVKKFDNDLVENVPSRKILGVSWNMGDDSFCFETMQFEHEYSMFTKRIVLSIIAKTFDPLGLLTPFSITLKILFQEIWRLGLDWDQVLPLDVQK